MKDYGKVLYIVIGVAAILLSYFLGFNTLSQKNTDLRDTIDELQTRYDTLKADYANKSKYIKETKDFEEKYDKTLSEFDTTLLNEGQIMDIYNMQGECGIQVTSVTLTAPEESYAFDGSLTSDEMLAKQNATNPDGTPAEIDPIITSTAINNSYRGVSNSLTLIATGNYEGIKAMLKSITDGKKRKVLSNIAFSYDSTTEDIICNLTLNEYAITGDDRKLNKVEIPDGAIGRTNIFFDALGVVNPAP